MPASSPVVCLVAPLEATIPDVIGPLTEAGFVTRRFGDPSATVPVAFVILADSLADPVPFTRKLRNRVEPGTPILWMVSRDTAELAPSGLEAGADVCLLRPAPSALLLSQLRALLRTRVVAAGADEVRTLTERLQKLYAQAEQDAELARRVSASATVALPDFGGWRFGFVSAGGLDVLPTESNLRLLFTDVAGLGLAGGVIAASGVTQELLRAGNRLSPAETLTAANRAVKAFELPESAVVSASVVQLEANSGRVIVSAAGFPAPVQIRPDSPSEVWLGSGLFLAVADTGYAETQAELAPGEKLILFGRGIADRRPDIRVLADAHRTLEAQALAETLAENLGSEPPVTLVVAERRDS